MTIDAIRKRYAANADADNPTYYCTLSSADVDALFAALDAEREKVEKLKATLNDVRSPWHIVYKNCMGILTGEGSSEITAEGFAVSGCRKCSI